MEKAPPITRGRKFSQVLEGARRVFLRDGFEGASVDDIAREAGVSKATLYSYFPDKRLMFVEVFRAELDREQADGASLLDADFPASDLLPVLARMITGHVVSNFGMRIYRLGVAEAERFPILAREYYEGAIMQLRAHLVTYFNRRIDAGELRIEDIDLAADQFVQLCATTVHDRAMFLGLDHVDDGMVERVSNGAARTFMAAYGTTAVARRTVTAAE